MQNFERRKEGCFTVIASRSRRLHIGRQSSDLPLYDSKLGLYIVLDEKTILTRLLSERAVT